MVCCVVVGVCDVVEICNGVMVVCFVDVCVVMGMLCCVSVGICDL